MRVEDLNIKVLTFPEEMIDLLESLSTNIHVLEVHRDFDNKPFISKGILNNNRWYFTQCFTLNGEKKHNVEWFTEVC